MTEDDKALVERLEEWEWTLRAAYKGGDLGTDEPAIVMGEASDRIEALSAENERLRERIERLRKALYAAYDDEPGWCDLTRAALGET